MEWWNGERLSCAGYVATIGFFDGVHRGHQFLINNIRNEAKVCGLRSMVITFDTHPRKVLQSDYKPRMLSTFEEKQALLDKTSIDCCAVLPFNREMAALSAWDFMEKVLKERLNVKKLYIGYDHRFGHNRSEGFDDYVRYGNELGIEVVKNEPFTIDGINISSSVIRALLSEGEVDMAARCLGYNYIISGKVVHGEQQGRKMGFPTANLQVEDSDKLIPASGVYAVKAYIDDNNDVMPAIMNIGTRPTFGGENTSIEVNIIDYNGDLYGHCVSVIFVKRIRDEKRFNSPAQLAKQIEEDRENALQTLS